MAKSTTPSSEEQNPVCRSSKGLLGSRAWENKMEMTGLQAGEMKNLRYDLKIKNRSSTADVPTPQKVSFPAFSQSNSLFSHSKEA